MQKYKITIVTDPDSWMRKHITKLVAALQQLGHEVRFVFSYKDMEQGDIAFLLSCYSIAKPDTLAKHKHNIVVHPSALPQGKGMSPLTWQILEGKNDIPMTLFEAVEKVDAGVIYLRDIIHFRGDELIEEMKEQQGIVTVRMCVDFIKKCPNILTAGEKQEGESTYYKRRVPEDSELVPNKTLAEQFNLLRTVDNEAYPAFFRWQGQTYIIKIHKSVK